MAILTSSEKHQLEIGIASETLGATIASKIDKLKGVVKPSSASATDAVFSEIKAGDLVLEITLNTGVTAAKLAASDATAPWGVNSARYYIILAVG